MSNWITMQDLPDRWGMMDFEILQYLKKGLQPYSKHGFLIHCPSSHHLWHKLDSKLRGIQSRIRMLEGPFFSPAKTKTLLEEDPTRVKKDIQERKVAIIEELQNIEQRQDDPDHTSWKYLTMPASEEETKELISELAEALFKQSDVEELEKKYGLGRTDKARIEENFTYRPAVKLRPSQRHKRRCREIAKKLWDEDPSITIADMYYRDEINTLFDGKVYTEKTVRNWIKDLCPDRSPGRRRSNPKE